MDISNIVTTPVTHVSGAITIGSVAVSKTAQLAESSLTSPEIAETTTKIMVTADTLAVLSFIVMVLTFIWNVYLGYRKDRRDEKQRQWERECREREIRAMERGKSQDNT